MQQLLVLSILSIDVQGRPWYSKPVERDTVPTPQRPLGSIVSLSNDPHGRAGARLNTFLAPVYRPDIRGQVCTSSHVLQPPVRNAGQAGREALVPSDDLCRNQRHRRQSMA